MNDLQIFLFKHKILSYFFALMISYIMFSPIVLGSLYDRLLFYPDKKYYQQIEALLNEIITPLGIVKEDVYIPVQNQANIHAWYFKKPSAKLTFLISHGNAGNICYRLHLLKALLPYGSVLLYDYEGYGKSGGEPSRQSIFADGLAAYDYLVKQQSVNPDDLILYGESLGCGVSCEISKARKVGGMILQSGWSSLYNVAQDKFLLFHLYPDYFFAQPHFDNVAILMRPHAPLLLIHGLQDKILPCRYSEEIFAKAYKPKQLVLLPNAGHNDIGEVDAALYAQSISNFLRTYCGYS